MLTAHRLLPHTDKMKNRPLLLLILVAHVICCVSGWHLNPLSKFTSPTYSRQYTYWKEEDSEEINFTFRQVFQKFGVRPPLEVPPLVWKLAYRLQLASLRLLHAWDKLKPPNSSLSLHIIWWKALMRLPAADWSYDLLPSYTRWVAKLKAFFPPLHHSNIELRTVFLDNRTAAAAVAAPGKIRLVVLGAGYDLRSLRFLENGLVEEAFELDLAQVIDAKNVLLSSQRFKDRRPNCRRFPHTVAVDLNDIENTRKILTPLLKKSSDEGRNTFTIFLLEGILVHLQRGSSSQVLRLLRSCCESESGCLIFADRIEGVDNRSLDLGRTILAEAGWNLTEFLASPTKTPHFGVAIPMVGRDELLLSYLTE
jgi:O-methyltransferase involved in polyketide biosynthesis